MYTEESKKEETKRSMELVFTLNENFNIKIKHISNNHTYNKNTNHHHERQ